MIHFLMIDDDDKKVVDLPQLISSIFLNHLNFINLLKDFCEKFMYQLGCSNLDPFQFKASFLLQMRVCKTNF